ncbi:MAG: T9SS type A sorting domain-containing protein [Williamsia sp.]|nr:T9SS type A sorting domain-containing protein [Williamsia sp.]
MRRFLLLPLLMAVSSFVLAQNAGSTPAVITIPVVVHVLYNNAQQNISDAQIRSQLDVLNKDYSGTNADRSQTPAYFANLAADCGFQFKLASQDPDGLATNGIVRKYTSIQYFSNDDRAKSATNGGDAAWNRDQYLNIWVCNLTGGLLGYTSAVGCAAEKDGVVISYTAFGTMGTATAPFNGGRTATHEIGHWLNLRHLWGDTYCGDDGVDDTPQQRASNRGTPTGERFTCGNTAHGDMYMNFMDLTDDASMHLFTLGQRQRMRALFASGGARQALLSTPALQQPSALVKAIPSVAETTLPSSFMVVYPNPASETIVVDINTKEAVSGKLVIFNAAGQPVLSQQFNSNHAVVSISQLPAGIYYLRQGNTGSFVKFMKR